MLLAHSYPVLTGILWLLIMWSNSSFICLYFSSVRGVSMRVGSSSGLSPPLFSFLLNACQVPHNNHRDGWRRRRHRWREGTTNTNATQTGQQKRKKGGRGKKGERKVQGSMKCTYTQSLSADHQIYVLVYFPVLVLGLGAVADRVVCVGVWAVTAI